MLWAVEVEVKDEYGLCQGAQQFWNLKHGVDDWNILAERLMEKLARFRPGKEEDSFSRNYHRDRLSDWAILALRNAGRSDFRAARCTRNRTSQLLACRAEAWSATLEPLIAGPPSPYRATARQPSRFRCASSEDWWRRRESNPVKTE